MLLVNSVFLITSGTGTLQLSYTVHFSVFRAVMIFFYFIRILLGNMSSTYKVQQHTGTKLKNVNQIDTLFSYDDFINNDSVMIPVPKLIYIIVSDR